MLYSDTFLFYFIFYFFIYTLYGDVNGDVNDCNLFLIFFNF